MEEDVHTDRQTKYKTNTKIQNRNTKYILSVCKSYDVRHTHRQTNKIQNKYNIDIVDIFYLRAGLTM